MSSPERIVVVVPVYNEGERLLEVLRGIPDFVRAIYVVDDHSSDRPSERVSAADFPRVEIIRHARNLGVGAAIATGYARALTAGADIVAVMGGDGQMDPRDLDSLIEPIRAGRADYVKGNRFLRPEVWRAMPPVRLIGNLALSVISKPVTGYWFVFDSQCGYTAISREALLRLPLDTLYPRYGVPNDILTHLNQLGARVSERPVSTIYHAHHSHMRLGRVIPSLALLLCRLFFRRQLSKFSRSQEKIEVAHVAR